MKSFAPILWDRHASDNWKDCSVLDSDLGKAALIREAVLLSIWGWATRFKAPLTKICVEEYRSRILKKVAKKEACATLGA